MKIRYSSRYFRESENRNSLSPEEELFIAQLENDIELEKEILFIRQKFSIPKDGYPEETMGDDYFEVIAERFSGRFKTINKEVNCDKFKKTGIQDDYTLLHYYLGLTCQKYNLHDFWIDSFECLIVFNVFPLLQRAEVLITYFGKGDYLSRKYIASYHSLVTPNNTMIYILQKCSKRQLHNWINNVWKKGLENEINQLPIHPKTHIQMLRVYQRIDKLKKQGNNSKQIADKLSKENLGFYGHESIKPMYNRYQQYLTSLKTKKG